MSRRRFILAASALSLVAAGCSGGGSSGGGSFGTTAAAATTTGSLTVSAQPANASVASAPAPVLPQVRALEAPETVPLILIHGHGGQPADWNAFMDRYGPGRAVVREIYAGEADSLKPGDLPLACVVGAGYYRDTTSGTKYDPDANGRGQGSIGGCPSPRTDGLAQLYPIAFTSRIARIVDGVRRATGSDRVDLALHSMGNCVGRAYTRWLSAGAQGGKSKVRRLYMVVGPNRGINALEATIDGLSRAGAEDFMKQGEDAEMCSEYKAWGGQSFMDRLNDGWDEFCAENDVRYAGISGTGAYGNQIDPTEAAKPPVKVLGISLTGPFEAIANAIMHLDSHSFPEVAAYINIWAPKVMDELQVGLSQSDGTVRLSSSRLDMAPFLAADAWATFEGRHGGNWNAEQGTNGSTFCSELGREFLAEKNVREGARIDFLDVKHVALPGKASWIALETSVSGAPLVSGQLVEETLDDKGQPQGSASSYGFPVPQGDQRVLFQPGPGGAMRRYRLMLYGPHGPAGLKENVLVQLVSGAHESVPQAKIATATATPTSQGPIVHVTATADVPPDEPTLGYSFKLDSGEWTAWDGKSSLDTPPLAPGEHRVAVRCAHAKNAASALVNDPKGDVVGLFVSSTGSLTVRR